MSWFCLVAGELLTGQTHQKQSASC